MRFLINDGILVCAWKVHNVTNRKEILPLSKCTEGTKYVVTRESLYMGKLTFSAVLKTTDVYLIEMFQFCESKVTL